MLVHELEIAGLAGCRDANSFAASMHPLIIQRLLLQVACRNSIKKKEETREEQFKNRVRSMPALDLIGKFFLC
jgi:hypothetical protein